MNDGSYKFKEEGLFDKYFRLSCGKRDIENGICKWVGEVSSDGNFQGLIEYEYGDDKFGSI